MSSWGSRNCKQQVQLRQINRSPDRSRNFLWKFQHQFKHIPWANRWKNSDVIYWKLYSRKLIPQTFQTAKFSKPQTNSTKRIHQKVSNCHSRFETSPKQILYVPNCRSRFETFRKQTPPWFEYQKVSEDQQNQDLKIFPDSVFQNATTMH